MVMIKKSARRRTTGQKLHALNKEYEELKRKTEVNQLGMQSQLEDLQKKSGGGKAYKNVITSLTRRMKVEKKTKATEKAKIMRKIRKAETEVALLGIKDTAEKLAKEGRAMRTKIEKDPHSARYLLEQTLCEYGALAMYREARKAYEETIGKESLGMILTASGGKQTVYVWLYFKNSVDDEKEVPEVVGSMPNPKTCNVGEDYPFPTAGMYNETTKVFAPMYLYTEYLKRVVFEGMATSIPGEDLLYLRCNYLFNDTQLEKKRGLNGVVHIDFPSANQYLWEKHGHPATNILCIAGETALRFHSVTKRSTARYKKQPKTMKIHTLTPGDGVWFGWRQYHASHVTEFDPDIPGSKFFPKNDRLQVMFSSMKGDFPEKDSEDTVHLHGCDQNREMYKKAVNEVDGEYKEDDEVPLAS